MYEHGYSQKQKWLITYDNTWRHPKARF
jgi:hypothetical protein